MGDTQTDTEAHNEIDWDLTISENSRHHTISIKWNEISKLKNWPWDKGFYSIFSDSLSPIQNTTIQFFENNTKLCDEESLTIRLESLGSPNPTYSSIPINLKELNEKLKLDLFAKKAIIAKVRFKEDRNRRKTIGEWWYEPFYFSTKLKASSIHITIHLPKLSWWKRRLIDLFRITERKYYDVIFSPYSSQYTLDVNKNGDVSLTIPEKVFESGDLYYTLPNINFKGIMIRLIGLIGIGAIGSYIATTI